MSRQTIKSLITTPTASNEPALYPAFMPVFIKAKNAGPNENVSRTTIVIVEYIKLRIRNYFL
ncbi:MAG: hypothetical protein V4635_05610 [Bacteroidota bacterium]